MLYLPFDNPTQLVILLIEIIIKTYCYIIIKRYNEEAIFCENS
jgi:hypothetical protein